MVETILSVTVAIAILLFGCWYAEESVKDHIRKNNHQ